MKKRKKRTAAKNQTVVTSYDTAFFDVQDLLELDEEEEFLREDADLIEDEDPSQDTEPIEDLTESLNSETFDRPEKDGKPVRDAEEEDLLSDEQVRDITREFDKIPEDIADLEAGEPAPREFDAFSDEDEPETDREEDEDEPEVDREDADDPEVDYEEDGDDPEEDSEETAAVRKRRDFRDRNERVRSGKKHRGARRGRGVREHDRSEVSGHARKHKEHAAKKTVASKSARNKHNGNRNKTDRHAASKKEKEKKPIRLTAFEWVSIAMSGLLVVAAVSLGLMYGRIRQKNAQAEAYQAIGTDLTDLRIIGESGLLAVRDASALKLSMLAEEELFEEPEEEEEEVVEEPDQIVEVAINLTSIKSDLKIKFVNVKTGKLIASVPFAVTAKSPSGKDNAWTDDDMDGIIYRKDVEAGTWSITPTPLGDSYVESYTLSQTKAKTISVKDKIEYKKVDVADEIKKESQVNVAAEDTEPNAGAVVESVNTDTVEWVESSREEIDGGDSDYREIDESEIDKSNVIARLYLTRWRTRATGTEGIDPSEGSSVAGDGSGTGDGGEGSSNANASSGEGGSSETSENSGTGGSDTGTGATSTESGTNNSATGGTSTGSADNSASTASGSTTAADASNSASAGTGKTESTAGNSATASSKTGASVEKKITVSNMTLFAGSKADLLIESQGLSEKKYDYLTSDRDIVSVENGTVTGIKAGKATITVSASEDSSIKATCTVTVADGSISLKTKNNETVYVKSGDTYREAVTADLSVKGMKFYTRVAEKKVIYRGWQTIDGHTYYFDKNGNYVTGDQVILGVNYHFNSEGILSSGSGVLGIDVSKHNGKIDWKAVKNSGVNYAIIRCGYRGTATGVLVEDPSFKTNIQGALNAGLKVGAYFYSSAVNDVEAVEEASMAAALCSGYKLSYPVFLDVERSSSGNGRSDRISKADRTAVIRAFCATMANSGYKTGLYANKNWMEEMIDTPSLTNYKLWMAQYAAQPTYSRTRYDMWQYTSSGSISGISGKVDLNVSYLGY